MKRYQLKKSAVYVLILSVLAVGIVGILSYNVMMQANNGDGDFNYINGTIFDNSIPVFDGDEKENTDNHLSKPFIDEGVKMLRSFYDYKGEEGKQQESIYYYGETYMQNEGIDYGKKEIFDVVSIYSGIVTEVTVDKILGSIVKIKHNNNVTSVYRSLSEITVKMNDSVSKGQVIGKSGTSNISTELENHVHFELEVKDVKVNPEEYFNKAIVE